MKILLISDNYKKNNNNDVLHETLIKGLKEKYNDLQVFITSKADFKPCIGCFKCWVKTPGTCIMKGSSQNISKEIIESDLVIFVSEVKYGCYSVAIKRVWDKQIPLILPFFTIIKGEMHHSARYKKYPKIIAIGCGEDITSEEEQTFIELISANAKNFHSENAKAYVCREENEIDSILNNVFKYISSMVV